MKDISSTRMTDHVLNYEQITKDMSQLGDEAVEAMNSVAFDPKSQKLAKKAEKENAAFQKELAIINEKPR